MTRFFSLIFIAALMGGMQAIGQAGVVEVRVVDADTGEILPARIELSDRRGRHPRPPKLPHWHHHFTCEGSFDLKLPAGTYQYSIERGPEYHGLIGSFMMKRDATDNQALELKRHITMRDRGWWSGDVWTQREFRELPTLLLGEDLHFAVPVAMPDDQGLVELLDDQEGELEITDDRFVDRTLISVGSQTGRVHFRPFGGHQIDSRRPIESLLADSGDSCHVQLPQPESWDTPLWLATGKVDSMIVHRSELDSEAETTGRPRDLIRFPDPDGVGRYRESIYHLALEAGLRLAPAAGTASGKSELPLGVHRTYVHLDNGMQPDAWWRGLESGRVVVTNGPLMVPKVNGQLPGHQFSVEKGDTLTLSTSLTLHTRSSQKIDYLQFVRNGETVVDVRLDEWAAKGGQLPEVTFDKSGWMVIRAVANDPDGYRYASTAPFYVDVGYEPRISRKATRFFLDWVVDRAVLARKQPEAVRKRLLPLLRQARDFWTTQLGNANAD